MAVWTNAELDTIGDAGGLSLGSSRRDGTLPDRVTKWSSATEANQRTSDR